MPSRAVADELIAVYFRTMELVFRILHIPTFTADYGKYWADPKSVSETFVVQMQLVMAIGAGMHDENFSMRSSAVRWVYEAYVWLGIPPEKRRLGISGTQVLCLFNIARQTAGVGGDLAYISAGSLLRAAIYSGLHRDPSRFGRMSMLRAEMHRRLWATVLELSVQVSLDSGGPPLLSMSDFDTEEPLNVNDEELTDDLAPRTGRTQRDMSVVTQTTVQILLLRTFRTRLVVAKHSNDMRSNGSFEEALRLHREVVPACQNLSSRVRSLKNRGAAGITGFHHRLIEMMTFRFISTLHGPFLLRSMDNPKYYFSRKVSLDVAKQLAGLRLAPALTAEGDVAEPGLGEFKNLITSGHGTFLAPSITSKLLPAFELLIHHQAEANSAQTGPLGTNASLTPTFISPPSGPLLSMSPHEADELFQMLVDTIPWAAARLKAGETNVKGLVFTTAILAQAKGLRDRMEQRELERYVTDETMGAVKKAWELLQEVADGLGIRADDGSKQDGQEATAETAWMRGSDLSMEYGGVGGTFGMGMGMGAISDMGLGGETWNDGVFEMNNWDWMEFNWFPQ